MARQEHELHLISFDICPYVERSSIVLEEKDLDYEVTFIDLSDKPDWFLEISPRGKVPVLQVDEEPVFESYVINELLEELYPEPRMFPEDPMQRARERSWIVYNNDVVMSGAGKMYMNPDDPERLQQGRETLEEAFEKLDEQLQRHGGPYFFGERFGLVDAVYAPVFNRWRAVEEIGHGDLLDDFEAVRAYGEALLDRESVQTARDDQLLDKMLDAA